MNAISNDKTNYWLLRMSASQYAVFHFDIKNMSMRDAEGELLSSDNDQPLIFNSLPDARSYSQQKIAATPSSVIKASPSSHFQIPKSTNAAPDIRSLARHPIPVGRYCENDRWICGLEGGTQQ